MKDITGMKFGSLTVVSRHDDYVTTKGIHKSKWECRCDCGNTVVVVGDNLRSGNTKTCGCSHPYRDNWQGQLFGHLTVLKEVPQVNSRRRMLCRCDCGNTKEVDLNHLTSGGVTTCGCRMRQYEDLTGLQFGHLLVLSENKEKYTKKAHRWNCKCLNCGNTTVVSTTKLKTKRTRSCGCVMSYGEQQITKILIEYNIKFKTQFTFEDLKSGKGGHLRFDFCVLGEDGLPEYLIEYQGEQHFRNSFGISHNDFISYLERDELKRNYCKVNNIPLVEINYDQEITPEKILMFRTKAIYDEDFVQYKKASMFISNTACTFKCDIENGTCECINRGLAIEESRLLTIDYLIQRYINNPITSSVVFGGLENFDQFDQLFNFIKCFRKHSQDDVVIYTGYYKDEIQDKVQRLASFPNVIIKFGRYVPNKESHYDEILGINLVSDNQYAEKIS